jgi:hypothetical protein
MTSGERQGPALEIVQTRDIDVVDRRGLSHLWEKLVWRKGVSRLYTASFYLWYAFAAFLTVSILMTVRALNNIAPDLALQLVIASLGFAIFLIVTQWVGTRLAWNRHWAMLRAGDRYALEPHGLRWSTARGMFSCGLDKVETIINDEQRLIAVLPHDGGLFVVKSAFEGQDVEAFGAELVRRWHEHRGLAGAAA